MRVRILGGGWYGCHLALALIRGGHEVELHEIGDQLFSGASGANPARLHQGFHYPRSGATQAACQAHAAEFMAAYGALTVGPPINIYAIATAESLVDFPAYVRAVQHIPMMVRHPADVGLVDCEGAVQTSERHIVIRRARQWFTEQLGATVLLNARPAEDLEDGFWDWTIDCTFCACAPLEVDRYEPCLTGLAEGPSGVAVTIMDGPFPSLYPWDEEAGLASLTSASLTPLGRYKTYDEARAVLQGLLRSTRMKRAHEMRDQLARYWSGAERFKVVDCRPSIRAMPRSAAASRLCEVAQVGRRLLRVRPGKIDAIFHAQREVERFIPPCS